MYQVVVSGYVMYQVVVSSSGVVSGSAIGYRYRVVVSSSCIWLCIGYWYWEWRDIGTGY